MTVSPDLLLAILSMDSYNRGYGAGLTYTGNQIGNATALDVPEEIDQSAWQDAGFYAVAYDTPDGIVISYRGTEDCNKIHTPEGRHPWAYPRRLTGVCP